MLACVCRPVSSALPKPSALTAPQKRPPSMVVTCEPRTTSANLLNNNNCENQHNSNVDRKVKKNVKTKYIVIISVNIFYHYMQPISMYFNVQYSEIA